MPNSYNEPVVKKYLDADGLAYFSQRLNNYPTNDVIAAVINGVQDALDEKADIADLAKKQDLILSNSTAGWRSNNTFIPSAGQIIIYTDKATYEEDGQTITVPGIKIGDGLAYGIDLPFLGEKETEQILNTLTTHIGNSTIHITNDERELWNNKLNCLLTGEILEFNRN